MKLAKIATAIALTTLAASAFAGPDWDVIQRARQAAQQQKQQQVQAAKPQSGDKNMGADCMEMMKPKTSTEVAPQHLGSAIGTHGTTYSDSDATSNRVWGVVLASATSERSVYLDGARITDPRDVYTDGAKVNDKRDVFTDGARALAGLDMKGVSSAPARAIDPYLDGARVTDSRDVYTGGGKVNDKRDVFTDGARTLAGMDTTGVSAPPKRSIDAYSDGARSKIGSSVA